MKKITFIAQFPPPIHGLSKAVQTLYKAKMNDEIIFLHLPKYIQDKNFELNEEEYKELDDLAKLLLNPDENFDELLKIWNNNPKYRIMSGALNG